MLLSLAFRLAVMGAGAFLVNSLFPHALTTTDEMARVAYFALLFLVVVCSSALPRIDREHNAFSVGVVWAGAVAALVAGYQYRDDLRAEFEMRLGAQGRIAALARAPGEVELRRTWDGHFRAPVDSVGGSTMFLIDTGASLVLIPWEDAQAMGVDMHSLDFTMPVQTANGESLVAPVRMPEMRIGNLSVPDVRAAVAPPGALHGGLLGMSFLNRLSEVTFRGDRVILKN